MNYRRAINGFSYLARDWANNRIKFFHELMVDVGQEAIVGSIQKIRFKKLLLEYQSKSLILEE